MHFSITFALFLCVFTSLFGAERAIPLAWPASGAPYSIAYQQSISAPADVAIRKGFLAKVGDFVLGESRKPRSFLRPFTIATDAAGRLIVADPGAPAVHLLDPAHNKHKVLEGPSRQHFQSPIGIDTDAAGNIYVADSALGKIFVFNKDGRFKRFIGDARGEGLYKRPTGLAIDRTGGRIYLTDTLRHKVHVLDFEGRIVREWGRRGEGDGEFNFPTAVALAAGRVFVLDAMNFRVQVFTPEGRHLASFGKAANEPGGFFRPKGLSVDEGSGLVYVVDAMFQVVQAFTLEGRLVFAFGQGGTEPGEFRLPAGICLEAGGRLLVADSFNRRIQVFRALPAAGAQGGAE